MPFATGTINNATTGAAAGDLRTEIEALLSAHSNWELIDSYTASTFNVHMWRCNSANSMGVPFYLGLITNTNQPTYMIAKVFEDYVLATKTAYRGATSVGSGWDAATASPWGGVGYAPEHTNWSTATEVTCATTLFTYRIRVTASSVTVCLNTANGNIYVGTFTPLWTNPYEFPICQVALGQSSHPGLTRRPGASGGATNNYQISSQPTAHYLDLPLGILGTSDGLRQGRTYAARMAIYHYAAVPGSAEIYRGYLGLDIAIMKVDAAVLLGDTVTINGMEYVLAYLYNTAGAFFVRTD